MPIAGRKPKADGQKRNRHAPTHDWTEVPNVPYAGKRPALPTKRGRVSKSRGAQDEFETVALCAMTRRWWKSVSTMPHCALWTAADWQFAIDTAIVADRFYVGEAGTAGELRQREKLLGTTIDARRDLRIRYVEPVDQADAATNADVTSLPDYRRRLVGGDA